MRRPGLLDLNEVVQHPGKRVRTPVATQLESEADLDLCAPVVGDVEAVSTGNVLIIVARLGTTAVLECSRCGEPIELALGFELREQFEVEGIPASYSPDGSAKVVCDEPGLFEGNALVVDELVRQGVWLNLPVQPVCSAPACQREVRTDGGEGLGHPGLSELGKIVREAAG
jgi:uncharacterized protein